jgi:hypothetical protein
VPAERCALEVDVPFRGHQFDEREGVAEVESAELARGGDGEEHGAVLDRVAESGERRAVGGASGHSM